MSRHWPISSASTVLSRTSSNRLYSSFGVSTKVRQAEALTKEYKIPGVPNFVVNGKYLVLRART